MSTESQTRFAVRRLALLGATILAGHCVPAFAQDASPATAANVSNEDIIVTGYRASLLSSTNAKRDAIGFTDSVFAEDIGKFPDTNIAESFNRIPGITIVRDTSGEGLNVAIRGLGTNFTKVLLNGAPVAVASSGRMDSQNTNREVDLDMFPTELFTQLTVSKTPTAEQVEGGAAGTVDMRSARPFDKPGTRIAYSLQGTKNSAADGWGQRGSLLASTTFGDFGVIAGVTGVRNKVNTKGFETIGWTNANLSAAQCGAATGCNNTGGGNWSIPGTVPSNAGNGLTAGETIDKQWLLDHNPGLTIQQIDNALLPRLGRPSETFGTKKRYNAIFGLQYKPSDDLNIYVDSLYGRKKNNLQRIDMNWVVRSGAPIPINMQVDRDDCGGGCVVTDGTFANSQFFLEYRPFIEDTKFWGVNPGIEWQATDTIKVDLQGNWTESRFHRESPSVVLSTAANSGLTVDYSNDGGIPSIASNVDLNDPANFGWFPGSRVNVQDERRLTKTKGIRGNLTWGDARLNLRVGGAYDDVSRRIRAYDNSQAWQNAACGGNPNVFLLSPNSQPACEGLTSVTPGQPGYPSYPALGTGYSSGITTPLVYQGSLIPNSAVASYLRPGPGFVTLDWKKFAGASNYDYFHDNAPEAGAANTGASGGYVREKTTGAYAEVNGDIDVAGNPLRFNIGIRYAHTDQTIGGQVSLADPRNPPAPPSGPNPADGSLYPNVINFVETQNSYDNWLPSASAAYNVADNAVVRVSLSKTMTRPDPNAMLPGVNFSTPSADQATIGNPALKPFISKNIDLGFEYYTGGAGYVSFAAFRKSIKGFTQTGFNTVAFTDLAAYGITYDTLTPSQQQAIDARGGPGQADVVVQQQVNATGTLTVNGLEFNWVQPLDFLLDRYLGVKGFGFTANATIIDQKGTGAAPAVALGVAKYAYNLTAYYENGGFMARLSTTYNKGSQSSLGGQNGISAAALFSDSYQQWDFSSSVDLEKVFGLNHGPQLTFDVVNIFNAKQRSYFQFENATFTQYKPGTQFLIGLRGTF
ncbi:TonB-dependent receptor [Sphingomonas sp. MM-1]|uniref:TonB-dependent receptor n=1 Tax=Sphingomonas sp. MM-1 TaxID=745310 RepID=UPI0005A45CDD|nr:TonB-dependent receptor [Sphingomonas sp. MM-1]